MAYFKENGYDKDLATRAWKGYDTADWHDSNGKQILNWKQKCQNTWFQDSNKPDKSKGEKVSRTHTSMNVADNLIIKQNN